mmetsp:Transcript_47832/g.144673  ORF Transcript_47832/g.144673 Transcript_47832/m.144673 type:complete len:202 (-) Transcript_47832:52-657(-)
MFCFLMPKGKRDLDLSSKQPCKQSCSICSCHSENMDPGKMESSTTCSGWRDPASIDMVARDVFASNRSGTASDWLEEERSSDNNLSPYLSIIAFRRLRCHIAGAEKDGDGGEFSLTTGTSCQVWLAREEAFVWRFLDTSSVGPHGENPWEKGRIAKRVIISRLITKSLRFLAVAPAVPIDPGILQFFEPLCASPHDKVAAT